MTITRDLQIYSLSKHERKPNKLCWSMLLVTVRIQRTLQRLQLFLGCPLELIRTVGQQRLFKQIMFWLATTQYTTLMSGKYTAWFVPSQTDLSGAVWCDCSWPPDSKREEILRIVVVPSFHHTIPSSLCLSFFLSLTLLLFLQIACTLGQPHAHNIFVEQLCRKQSSSHPTLQKWHNNRLVRLSESRRRKQSAFSTIVYIILVGPFKHSL